MYLLVSFDLPRDTKFERRVASKYRTRLLELGFSMKQFSLYESMSAMFKKIRF